MTAVLNRRYHFSASHRLHAESLSDAENAAAYGKCNNPHGHGHNYIVTVRLAGSVSPETGMVANLADLDGFARQHLLERFHLSNLNVDPAFAGLVPTSENLAVVVHRIFAGFPYATLQGVTIDETSNNSFLYEPASTLVPAV